jgi:hypothetical protein
MKAIRLLLVIGVAAVGSVAVTVGSCVIDDEPTYISGARCTRGSCAATEEGGYSCDVDRTCTPAPGCEDWDCDEDTSGWNSPDADADADTWDPGVDDAAVPGEVSDVRADGGGEGEATDLPDAAIGTDGDGDEDDGGETPPSGCSPVGGGPAPETAEEITLGVAETDRTCCPETSQWFKFHADAGSEFEVDVDLNTEGNLVFRIYAGDELEAVASAELGDDSAFAARADTSADYYLRIRATGDDPVGYSFTVNPLP